MNQTSEFRDYSRPLMRLGVVLFLLGLLTGFAVPFLALPRVGLTSHLEGIINGILLLVIGLIWSHLRFSARAAAWTFWLLVYATFANWLATLLSAVTGAGGTLPLASGGQAGANAAEIIVGVLLLSLSIVMVGVCALLLHGLRGR